VLRLGGTEFGAGDRAPRDQPLAKHDLAYTPQQAGAFLDTPNRQYSGGPGGDRVRLIERHTLRVGLFLRGRHGGSTDAGDVDGGIPEDIRGTDDPFLYKFYRLGDFSYDIPLADGSYAATLGFLEPDREIAVGERVFTVTANGQTLLEHFDVRQAAGAARTVVTHTFPVDVSGGRLVLDFTPAAGDAVVSTIKIIRSSGTPTP
jgi:hypothetical protein